VTDDDDQGVWAREPRVADRADLVAGVAVGEFGGRDGVEELVQGR
jgi:hypothetical protein